MEANYYDNNPRTTANSEDFIFSSRVMPHFPTEGLFIGKLLGTNIEVPALVDLIEKPSLCFLYNSPETRQSVNNCIERLVWRLAATLPPKLARFTLFCGGNPGESFNTHNLINGLLFPTETEKVYYSGNADKFAKIIDSIHESIIMRMSSIGCANAGNLVGLNENLDKNASIKYEFIVLTDFPKNIRIETFGKIAQIIQSGTKAGIHIIMSWDMSASFENDIFSAIKINPQSMLEMMEIIFPSNGRLMFRNSGHDEILNRFKLEINGEPINSIEAHEWAKGIDEMVAIATKVEKRGVIKQDYNALETHPFEQVISEISISVGIDLTDKQQISLKFNSGDFIHAFILGQSGSGKSVLLNNIISSAILKYSPTDLVLYLMDFKGVEFNRYKGEKHTKAVLVDNNDPQMTLEVLRELKEENRKRVKLWQAEGVNNIDGYNRRHPESRLPQVLFVADECQVLFQSPRIGGVQMELHREITDILNTIATQGRSQGIHMLLATQQLDETDISGQILKNLTECFLLMSAPSDSNKLVPDSSDMTAKQATGLACYYHKKDFIGQVQTFYANDDELEQAIDAAQKKASNIESNGGAYFCGSSKYSFSVSDVAYLKHESKITPIAIIGKAIGLKGNPLQIILRKDFAENILFFGANKQEQTVGVVLNALFSLIVSYKAIGSPCDFLVVDCLSKSESAYKPLLKALEGNGLCHIIERQKSTRTIKAIAEDLQKGIATPVILTILGSERYIEMKRNEKLRDVCSNSEIAEFEPLGFDDPFRKPCKDVSDMTFQQAFTYILDEGPMQGVHTLLQVDKPGNILFEGDYGDNATDKFRHKVILRSENKYLGPLRFSRDIDVESLSDDEEHLRAYYYPEGDDPVLFTPFILPDLEVINNI